MKKLLRGLGVVAEWILIAIVSYLVASWICYYILGLRWN